MAEQPDAAGKYGMSGRGDHGSGPKYWPTILRGLEMVISIICIALIDEPTNNVRSKIFITQRTVGLAYATFGAFLIVSTVYVLGKLVRDNWPWKTSALLSLVGTIMYIASAVAILADWANVKERNYWTPSMQRYVDLLFTWSEQLFGTTSPYLTLDLLCATGFMALAAGVVFLVDFVMTLYAGIKGRFDDD